MDSDEGLQAARAIVDDDMVLSISRQLIAIPSPSKHEGAVSKFIFSKLDEWGLGPRTVGVEGYGSDVIAEIGPKDAPAIVLNGHIDTVEVMAGWKHDPYEGKVENGMLFGLGALDMKCGLAAMMVALKGISDSGLLGNHRVVFQAVSGEETNSAGTRALLARGELRSAKAVVVGEGFGGLAAVTHGRRGGFYWDIDVTGKAAHGASPHLGINAVSDAARIVCALDSMGLRSADGLSADDWSPLAEGQTVLRISGEMSSLSVPEMCHIKMIRCPVPGSPGPGDVQKEIENVIETLGLRSKVYITLENGPGDLFHPYLTPANSALVRTTLDCVSRLTGTRPKLVIGRSEADDNLIAQELGIPVICLGPGESGDLAKYHQAEEAVHVDQLGDAARAYMMIALELCGERSGAGQ